MNHSLVWYRNDLRTQDHEPLQRAIEFSSASAGSEPGSVYCLYCFDDDQWSTSPFGFPKTGTHRTRFLRQSVEDLRNQLQRLGGELIIRQGDPAKVAAELIAELQISAVFCHAEVGTEEQQVEEAVRVACRDATIECQVFHGCTLFHPDELPFAISQLPELFTQFRRQLEKTSHHRAPLAEPKRIPCKLPAKFSLGHIPTFHDLMGTNTEQFSDPVSRPQGHRDYIGGQSAGLARLDEYIWQNDRLRIYKETRNGMLNVDDSSKFSPWLANGSLSPRTIAAEVARYEQERVSNQSTYWMIFELLWRDYFHFITAKHGRRLFQVGGIQRRSLPWNQDTQLFDAWKEGRTGYPLVDANMRELAATGYMSNRGRQNVGSFLCKNLGIDWRMGAEWFESQLLDYACASNYGNWNYVAGVGNDARGFRFFNITKQSRDYDPDGSYVRYWLPELADVPAPKVHEPWKLSDAEQTEYSVTLGQQYPLPIVDLFESAKANERKYEQ